MEIITVKSGDTVSAISENYGVSKNKIIADNGLDENGTLVVGQSLIILEPTSEYTVIEENERITGVSMETGVSPQTLLRNNIFLKGRRTFSPPDILVTAYSDRPVFTGITFVFDSATQLKPAMAPSTTAPFSKKATPPRVRVCRSLIDSQVSTTVLPDL